MQVLCYQGSNIFDDSDQNPKLTYKECQEYCSKWFTSYKFVYFKQ